MNSVLDQMLALAIYMQALDPVTSIALSRRPDIPCGPRGRIEYVMPGKWLCCDWPELCNRVFKERKSDGKSARSVDPTLAQ